MGVNSLVLAPGGEPAVMDDTEVDLLRSAPPIKIERIRRGDVVRVTEGPLYGHQGICSAAGDERVSVLFALLGRTTTVQLATASVECV